MILGFKERFVSKIAEGSKIHTIREDAHERWKPGMTIHFATGVRTKNYKQFMECKCCGVQAIEIKYLSIDEYPLVLRPMVYIDNHLIYDPATNHDNGIDQLAENDGFDCVDDFFDWFSSDFKGKIIHWTYLRY